MREHTWITPLLWQTSVPFSEFGLCHQRRLFGKHEFRLSSYVLRALFGNQTLPSCTLCGCKQATRRSCQYFSTMPKSVIRWANRMPNMWEKRENRVTKSDGEAHSFVPLTAATAVPLLLNRWCNIYTFITITNDMRHMPPNLYPQPHTHTRTTHICNDDNDFRRNTLVYSRTLSLPLSFSLANIFSLVAMCSVRMCRMSVASICE